MAKQWFSLTAALATVVGALLLTPVPASAQRGGGHGGGHGGGGYHGGGGGDRGGSAYRGGYYGGGYRGGDYGRGGYYGRYGWGGYLGYYGGYASGYYGGYYGYAPDYDSGSYSAAPDYSAYPVPSDDYAAAPAPAARSSTTALVTVRVADPNADVWFNGTKTAQKGNERLFESPELAPGRGFTYDVRARWTDDNGRVMDQTRETEVHAGDRLTVDFPARASATPVTPSP
jgi:uncharacterized protein (TIGR03000 family)